MVDSRSIGKSKGAWGASGADLGAVRLAAEEELLEPPPLEASRVPAGHPTASVSSSSGSHARALRNPLREDSSEPHGSSWLPNSPEPFRGRCIRLLGGSGSGESRVA